MGRIILEHPTEAQLHAGNMAIALPGSASSASASFLELMRVCGLELVEPGHVSGMMRTLITESKRHGAYDYVFRVRMAQLEGVPVEESMVISLYRDRMRRFVAITTTEDGLVRAHLMSPAVYIHGMQFAIGQEPSINWGQWAARITMAVALIAIFVLYVWPWLSKIFGGE